jgi:electron transport complex protein RnfC
MRTFSGGSHLQYLKETTQDKTIRELPLPKKVILPLQQNLGCPCEPLVKVGDEVAEGAKIGDSQKFVSAPVHASISGKVIQIEKLPNPCGFEVPAVVIEGPGASSQSPVPKTLESLTAEDIKKIVREAGIVGMGGAAFPTHVKLSPPADKKIDTIIINGCECEPYITADHRIMLEKTADIIYGARAIAKAVGAQRILVGVENNKKNAIEKLKSESRIQQIEIVEVKTKYPQGGEKQLIKALLNREVPSGGLPLDIGVVVQNVGTAVAIAEAIKFGVPLIKRVVTVTGSGIKQPQNVMVRIGASFSEVIEQCGGLTEDTVKVIMGGPMMGLALSTLDLPVVKGTTCILALYKKDAVVHEEKDCIRCGRCIKSCPIGLLPNFIADAAKLKDWGRAEEYNVADCIECGCCSYVCPSRIYLVQYFKVAKKELSRFAGSRNTLYLYNNEAGQTRKAVCK